MATGKVRPRSREEAALAEVFVPDGSRRGSYRREMSAGSPGNGAAKGPSGRPERRPERRHAVQQEKAKRARRRRRAVVGLGALGFVAAALVVARAHEGNTGGVGLVPGRSSGRFMALKTATGETVMVPNVTTLSALRARIVEAAESQIGYRTDPSNTYCNKYSAYWHSGAADCSNADLSEEWCADFAAWVWQKAGVPIVYQYINGDINSSAASFFEWGRAHGTWHPLGSGYVPQPGDVAVYGLNVAALYASHVAVVVGYSSGQSGPVAVNGDGDLTGFSVVEVRADEYDADTHPSGSPLSGYVSPD